MTAKELNRIFQKGECLSLDTMRLYIDGKLHPKSMHEVEKHLIECSLCSAAMDGLTPRRMKEVNRLSQHIEKRLAVYMNTPPPVPFFRRFGLAIAGGILLIGGTVTWWVLSGNNSHAVPGHDTAVISDTKQQNVVTPPPSVNTSAVTDPAQDNNSAVTYNPVVENHNPGAAAKMQELPASLPGQTNTLSVTQEQQATAPNTTNTSKPGTEIPASAANSRNATASQPLRIKNVQVYPAVTHSEKKSRKESGDGQLGRSQGSDASFKLDEMPSYPGGDQALKAYIMDNFKPMNVDRSKITRLSTGVMFIVNSKTGVISAPELSFSISPDVDAELMRIIKAMPNWDPGKKRGEVDVMLGITFE